MQKNTLIITLLYSLIIACSCSKAKDKPQTPPVGPPAGGSVGLVNMAHLTHLTVPVTFPSGNLAAGIYIYSNAPDYTPAYATGEGFTCLDDVSRAALVYLRNPNFSTDTAIQAKAFGLLRFITNMQSANGYFYNFLQTGNVINTSGATSVNQAKWWSWRALQALAEASPRIRTINATLSAQVELAISNLVSRVKTDLINLPQTTATQDGIVIPQWLPEGADAGATLLLGLIPYCQTSGDVTIRQYIKKLADGIVMMQQGDATHFPYDCFLSSGTLWHAYGSDQAHALFQTATLLNDTMYANRALAEVDNFYPWMLQNGFNYSFELVNVNNVLSSRNVQRYEQIAYGIRPFVSAAVDAYALTNNDKYAGIAAQLAAWFTGKNPAGIAMYDTATGRCFDAIATGNTVNRNAGAESCIEALLTMQLVEKYPAVKTALNKYK